MAEIRNINNNIIINLNKNTYREEEPKKYLYCWKCCSDLKEPSLIPFCDDSCRNEYYRELRKEADACFNEFCGRD